MPIVDELHFKESALKHVEKAKQYEKEKDYLSAAYEWGYAADEGFYLAHRYIASYYSCDYFEVEQYPGDAKYRRAIEIFEILLDYDIREFDYLRIMASIGYAYKKLGNMNLALEYYKRAGSEGLYQLYLYYFGKRDYNTANKYYEQYASISHVDPGHIYFDL